MFIGQRNSCQVAPNEVFTQALRIGAYRIILVHNHPSGDVTPSEEDVMTTQRFLEIGKLCGIECLDHVIVGHNRYFRIKEKQMIAKNHLVKKQLKAHGLNESQLVFEDDVNGVKIKGLKFYTINDGRNAMKQLAQIAIDGEFRGLSM